MNQRTFLDSPRYAQEKMRLQISICISLIKRSKNKTLKSQRPQVKTFFKVILIFTFLSFITFITQYLMQLCQILVNHDVIYTIISIFSQQFRTCHKLRTELRASSIADF